MTDAELNCIRQYYPWHKIARRVGRLKNNPMGIAIGFSCVFRRSLLRGVALSTRPHCEIDASYGMPHDRLVYMLANALGSTIYLPEILAYYRRHDRTASSEHKIQANQGDNWVNEAKRSSAVGYPEYIQRATYALVISRWFRVVAQNQPTSHADSDSLVEAAEHYKWLADVYSSRAAIYNLDASLFERIQGVISVMMEGGYLNASGNAPLSLKSMLKDAVHGIRGASATYGKTSSGAST